MNTYSGGGVAVYSVIVAKNSEENFLDGIANGIWGFTSETKIFPRGARRPVRGDYAVFGFALHKSTEVDKRGFPRVDSLNTFLNHFKPYVEMLTICQITHVCDGPDHSIVTNSDGQEIWMHEKSAVGNHKFPYRLRLKALRTYHDFDFLNNKLSHRIVEAFRLSSSDVGSLRFASDVNVFLEGSHLAGNNALPEEITLESKATQKLIEIEVHHINRYQRRETEGGFGSRAEGQLVSEFCDHLGALMKGARPQRTQITMPDGANLYTDLTLDGMLIEAKSDTSRNSIRTAIGQLFDYENLLESNFKKAILLPNRPEESLCRLISKLGFILFYKSGEGFTKEDFESEYI